MTHRVVFTPSGLSGEVAEGTTVLDAARRLGADLDTVCGGRGICGRCQVSPTLGSFAKWSLTVDEHALSPWTAVEAGYHGARPLVPGQRLGCAVTIDGDVVIDIPPASQVHHQVVRKDLDLPPIVVDPLFALYYVEITKADLESGRPASDLVTFALADQHGVSVTAFDPAALRGVYRAIAGLTATIACRGDRAVAVWPGFVDTAYGIAVDIGSTTIAGHLCELLSGDIVASAGRMNPQIRFGEDLMSRVSYVMMNEGGAAQLTEAVRTALDSLAGDLLDSAGGVSRDRVLDVVVVGNPIMHHLVLGIDPTPLGMAPFTLATNGAVPGRAGDIGLALPHASFYAGPCIAGHVGADTSAAVLAEGPHRGTATQLLVDVGTNAEIVLGNRERLLAASSPTGPAFEGAQISCGQRATAGAVESVRIDPDTRDVRIKVIGVECWSDEPDFVAGVAKTGITGVCGSGIIDLLAEMSLTGLLAADGTIRPPEPGRTGADRIVADGRTFRFVFWRDGDRELSITQNDVRAIQLAKAALRAGIELLLEHAGRPTVTDIRLAGAFGAHIDPYHAMVLGLVPECPLEGVRSVGNAAGAGAVIALLSASARTEMETVVRSVVKIETATEPRFQELFVDAMAIPHGSATRTSMRGTSTRPRRRARP